MALATSTAALEAADRPPGLTAAAAPLIAGQRTCLRPTTTG